MPELKSRHFVPKCYLRNFASDQNKNAVNIFNIKRKLSIKNGSMNGQCARSYFYGRDLTLERSFQGIEGAHASITKKLAASPAPSESDINTLKYFSFLQFLRTKVAIERQSIAMEEMTDLVFENSPEQRPTKELDSVDAVMSSFTGARPYIDDLRCILAVNRSSDHFITSDDPVADFNKFYRQKISRHDAYGIISSGYCIYIPISPSRSCLTETTTCMASTKLCGKRRNPR